VTGAEALTRIKAYAGASRYWFAEHALERMEERGARRGDVLEAIRTARKATRQESGRWRVDGVDLDGDDLGVIVALDGTVVAIITVI
jgi:hypothetical protein